MQNTGIIYTSEERTPTVLPELAELLPPLSDEQLSYYGLQSVRPQADAQ